MLSAVCRLFGRLVESRFRGRPGDGYGPAARSARRGDGRLGQCHAIGLVVHFAQRVVTEVRVTLRRGGVLVAEKFADNKQAVATGRSHTGE